MSLTQAHFGELNLRSLRQVAFQQMRSSILSGELKAGEPLLEVEIAKALGMSATPVREALRMLELEGLVLSIPHKGTCVREFSPEELAEACEIRAVLEGYAALRAAPKITPAQLDELRSLLQAAEPSIAAHDYAAAGSANTRFHEIIWEASGSRRLMSTLETMRDHIQAMRARVFAINGQAEVGFREHIDILEALESHNAPLAQEMLSRHIFALVDPLRWPAATPAATVTAGSPVSGSASTHRTLPVAARVALQNRDRFEVVERRP